MIRKLKYLARTELIKTLFFSSVSTFFRALSGLILNKVVASYVGSAGVAFVGQFTNFFGIVTAVGSGGIENGVVKYVAQHHEDEPATHRVISTAATVMVACSLVTALVVLLFAGYFSDLLFKSQNYKFILFLTALSIVIVSLKSLLMAVLNGHKEVVKYTRINIIISLSTLALSLLLVAKYKLSGILTALVVCQMLAFIIALFFTVKYHLFSVHHFFQYFDKRIMKNLSGYSLITLVGAFSFPLALLMVRNYIGSHLSWQDAGYWQGVWMISEGYQVFIISALSFYYLPRLSEIAEEKELRAEIVRSSKIMLPIVSAIAIFIFLIRGSIVNILFTKEFAPMLPLFKYQLLGDIIRMAGWLISYQMISKAMTRLYIITSIFFNFSFVILAMVFIKSFGLEGVSIAFFVNSILYLLFSAWQFRNLLFVKTNESVEVITDYPY